MRGVSMLLLEKDSMPGITTKRMDCQGVWPSGTTYVEFDQVKVPVANLIGKENEGFGVIMKNFNHERWGFVVQATRFSRVLLEDSWNFANKRSTFGKKLVEHPVIRWKLAEMTRQVEGIHHWLENMTFQLCQMPKDQAMTTLGGPIALMKAHSSKIFEYCAREARQIFGGNAYTRSGLGERAERLYRDVGAYAIPGGSEEILLDLAIRQERSSGKRRELRRSSASTERSRAEPPGPDFLRRVQEGIKLHAKAAAATAATAWSLHEYWKQQLGAAQGSDRSASPAAASPAAKELSNVGREEAVERRLSEGLQDFTDSIVQSIEGLSSKLVFEVPARPGPQPKPRTQSDQPRTTEFHSANLNLGRLRLREACASLRSRRCLFLLCLPMAMAMAILRRMPLPG
ncbi:apdG [Symbiodinium sp. CCMP2592]|nr:apdG [Symbiodinium sp. CCMP2592]